MHICVLSDGYPPWEEGGAQRIASQLATTYRQYGHEVSVITTVPNQTDTGTTTVEDVSVYRIWTPRFPRALAYIRPLNPVVVRPVRRLLADLSPDVVHAHNIHRLSNVSLRLATNQGVPVVKTFHDAGTVSYGELTYFVKENPPERTEPVPTTDYQVSPWRQLRQQGPRYFPLRTPLNRYQLTRHVDLGVAVSRELRRALQANGIPCSDVVHNGVDASAVNGPETDETTASADGERSRKLSDEAFPSNDAFAAKDTRIVLFGGRTGYNKGGAHLAAAFGRVARSIDDPVNLIVTGDSEYVPRMRELAGAAGEDILATGWISRADLSEIYRMATVVASPSVHLDPFPTVNLEAFANATPVVTTCFGGARELVTDGQDGFVVNPLDIDALADALGVVLSDPDMAAEFGAAGHEKVTREFTVDQQAEAYMERFRSVI